MDELMLLNQSEEFFENPQMVEFVRGMMLSNPQSAAARRLRAPARSVEPARHPRPAGLAVSFPSHVVGAEHDILVPIWKSRELAELIPDARLTVIEGAPHGSNVERAEEFNQLVLGFIAETKSALRDRGCTRP